MVRKWLLAALATAVATGCGAASQSISDQVVQPVDKKRNQQPLLEMKERITGVQAQLEERFSIRFMALGVGANEVLLQIRSAQDIEKIITAEEQEEIREAVFAAAGSEFPLNLTVWSCCRGEPDITGIVRDADGDRILIVDEQKKVGSSDLPEAMWVNLQPDGILRIGGAAAKSKGMDSSLVGKEAQVWTTGFIADSYPQQASALKIVIE
ncbi:hypothetical protein ACVNS2_21310 [Paenibacillus caseinilyticus]|nr:hypothetical protein [Paenibacillus mucilaginosus]AFH63202.1 hypothetical protein B2K_21275 [Paenibacillus mucilaginosus K02]